MSYRQALEVIRRYGGKVEEDKVTVRSRKIKPVRYEKSFDGCGLVITGRLDNRKNGDYVADVDLTVDGESMGNIQMTEVLSTGQDHILHKYDFEEGHHIVRLSVNNPRDDKKLWVNRALFYTKDQGR